VSGADAPDAELDELARLGVYDPSALDAVERLELIRYLQSLGATVEQMAAAKGTLGDLGLDLTLRPDRPATLGAVVSEAGGEWSQAVRLLSAIGLPTDPDEPVTAEEAATARLLLAASRDMLGEGATVQLARVAGSAMARIAETIITTFRLNVEIPRRRTGTAQVEVVREYADLAQTLLPAFVSALDTMLRRQLVAVSRRMWSTDEEQAAVTMSRTVGFVDLVGYTAAAATMSVRELTDVLVQFDEETADAVLRGNGQIVKTIGDEAMFAGLPAQVARIAIALRDTARDRGLPPVRAGLASGMVVARDGDFYGPVVNLASRLTEIAPTGVIFASDALHADLASDDTLRWVAEGTRELRSIGPVQVFSLQGTADGRGPS